MDLLAQIKKWLPLGSNPMPNPAVAAQGTCEWLLSHPHFTAWTEKVEREAILWLRGPTGEKLNSLLPQKPWANR
jgi:hypothetical protein